MLRDKKDEKSQGLVMDMLQIQSQIAKTILFQKILYVLLIYGGRAVQGSGHVSC